MKDGGPDLGLDLLSSPTEKEETCRDNPHYSKQQGPQPSSGEPNAQGNPSSLLVTTAPTIDNNTIILTMATASDI